jgi:predicted RNase H-like HicB family nuclease
MSAHYILTDYIDRAIGAAEYDKLDDNSFAGSIPSCKGVVAFGPTLKECEGELRSTLEEWILLGLKLGHSLPVIDGIDLNKEPEYEPMEAV